MPIRREWSVAVLSVLLVGCGGGGGGSGAAGGGGAGGSGGSPAPAPAPVFSLSGSVSGLNGGTLVLAVSGGADVSTTANGSIPLASGLANGAAYAVTVKTQPTLYTCTVTNGAGSISGANVTNVAVACARAAVSLAISAPANRDLVPENVARNVTATFGGTLPASLHWQVLPAEMASNATVTAVSNTGSEAVVEFRATKAGEYTLRLTSDDDATQSAELVLRVHREYIAMRGWVQQATFLQVDGTVRSQSDGAPDEPMIAIAQGHRRGTGLRADGTVVSWGIVPVPDPAGLAQVKQIAAGHNYTLAIREDDTLVAWGKVNIPVVIPPSLTAAKFKSVAAANTHVAGILEDDSLVVFDGEGGIIKTNPVALQGKKIKQVCATGVHVVALEESGVLHVWPMHGPTLDPGMNTPPANSLPVTAIYCGSEQAALVQTDGRVMVWGDRLSANGAFDSATVSGFPRVKGINLPSYGDPWFLTEGGAVVDVELNLVTFIDEL